MEKYKFTIIVPIYNEEDNLFRLERELLKYIKTAPYPTTVLLINDGSTDNSQQYIEAICSKASCFNFISLKHNRGLSTAIKAGFDAVNTELVGYIDADLQTTPQDFNLLLKHIETYDFVTGIRTNRKDTWFKTITSQVANVIRRAFTKDGVEDTGCPLKVIKTEVSKNIPMFKGLHRFLPAMIKLQNKTVFQVPVRHYPRLVGKSKFGFYNRAFVTLMDCFAYLWIKKKYINYQIMKHS